jgi:uncharacterized protein (TIGR02246 family)
MAESKPEDVHRLFEKGFNAGDAEALMALYEPTATLVPQPGTVISGHAAIREALQNFLALKGKIKLETTYVLQSGDIALLRSQWHLTGTGPDGNPLEMSAKSAEVARRQSDGRWLYVVDNPYGAD